MSREFYNYGYEDGESSAHADWELALTTLCQLPADVPPTPTAVAKYIAALQDGPIGPSSRLDAHPALRRRASRGIF